MTPLTPENCTEELSILNDRLSRLAKEKSFLQLTINLINKIISVSGLDNITDNILRGVLNVIGGTNLALYYKIDDDIHYADITGEKRVLDRFDDDLVLTVFTTGTPLEQELDFCETQMMTPEFTKAFTWIYPLKIGSEVTGVLKIEHLHISLKTISAHIVTLLNYIAMALKNEILGHSRLKRANDELRVSKERFEKLFMEAPLGIALIDSQTGRIYNVNPMFAKIAGRTMEEMVEIDWMSITHPDDVQEDLDNMALMNAGKTDGFQIEKRYLHKDGSAVWINMTIAPMLVDDRDHPRHLCMIEDITGRKQAAEERKQLEQQLHQAQKLESLGVLAGGIAHDFNNILAIIICTASLAEKEPGMAAKLMPEIETAAQRAAALCRQMLAYAGKTQFVESSVNITALVYDMIGMLKSTLPLNITIRQYLAGDIPPLNADVGQIRQILMNMMINASEAIGEQQGDIRVALTKRDIGAENPEKDYLGKSISPGQYICLEVSDSGCGMDDETRQRIFEPFYTTKFVGRGLGMSALLGVVTSHKGALQLFSQPGIGTTFKVYLPAHGRDSVKEQADHSASTEWQGSGTILLVEDEPQLRDVAKVLLESIGFQIIVASNGMEALEQYRSYAAEIRLVLTDIGMPLMNGYQLIAELKKLDPKLPIITCSGFGDGIVTGKLAPGDTAGLLSKPYRLKQLREVLKGVLGDCN